MSHKLEIDEGQRQLILCALAEMAYDRPGWIHTLEEIAKKMDNVTPDGKAEMFDAFLSIHTDALARRLAGDSMIIPTDPGYPTQTY